MPCEYQVSHDQSFPFPDSRCCYNTCFENSYLIQFDWLIGEQFEPNEHFTFPNGQFYHQVTQNEVEAVPS